MTFDDSLRQDILRHADIVKIISSFLNVTKKGRNYVAVCPFHDDTNPSMSISPERKMFKCFVCGTGGDAISFVQKYLHISNYEAMKKVAELAGYDDPRLHKENKVVKHVDNKKDTILKCLKDLTLFYQYSLNTDEGKEGLDYLESRKLDTDFREKYKLGYAIVNGTKTIEFLQSRGHSLKTIEDAGISILHNGQYFDRYHGRVIFPICDSEGNVIAYSARRISNTSEAKYINSPETYVFTKNKTLYNYHIAKEKARIAGCVYVLEGFMDVFALAKIGIDNAVAIMGTALTLEHTSMLRELNVEIRLCLDGDLPGQTAMMKAAKALENAGLKFMIVNNRNMTKDPDEILTSEGGDSLRSYLNNLMSRVDFALEYYRNSNPLKTNEQKIELLKAFVPILLNIRSQLELDNYIIKLANITGYDKESIKDFLKRAKSNGYSEGEVTTFLREHHPEKKLLKRLQLAERELLFQMLSSKKAIKFYEEKDIGFYDEVYRSIANLLIEYAETHENIDPIDLIGMIESSDLKNKEVLLKEVTDLCFERNHPNIETPLLLENLFDSIEKEKAEIFEKDNLNKALEGKSELEKARIYSDYNRRKNMKNTLKKEEK